MSAHSIVQAIQQLRFPREYRLREAHFAEILGDIESATSAVRLPSASNEMRSPDQQVLETTLSQLAVQLWRLGNRLVDPETRQPTEETRIAYGRLRAAWDLLGALGIEVRDYINQEIADHGVTALKVLEAVPRDSLSRPTVIETVKPAVSYHGRLLWMAEVIVGVPIEAEDVHAAQQDDQE